MTPQEPRPEADPGPLGEAEKTYYADLRKGRRPTPPWADDEPTFHAVSPDTYGDKEPPPDTSWATTVPVGTDEEDEPYWEDDMEFWTAQREDGNRNLLSKILGFLSMIAIVVAVVVVAVELSDDSAYKTCVTAGNDPGICGRG